ncbi:MAG TPA: hypothetical protein P5121_24040 [Caldilineaceae bacterium]|nr:hypothetical protein [Caldilineaceae bacterium]
MLCKPTEALTYGGAISHVSYFSIYRRPAALHTMTRLGVTALPDGCPIEHEFAMREQRP